jgi:2,3-bisphosphoglycerate-independent phosphoglycerate mutase
MTVVDLDLIKEIARQSPTKIVLLVIDGLGGLPNPETGKTELETANIPNLDALAAGGICGLADPVAPGITPGSAPGHLALFGYDPVSCNIGRGVLEAVGIDVELQPGNVAARGNFCTVDEKGLITDRRAGRISNEKCAELCELLDGMTIDDTQVLVYPVREHRFVAVFRGKDLTADVTESDPHQTGVTPLPISALSKPADRLAGIANKFIAEAKTRLAKHHPANMVLLRGFSELPHLPTMSEIYKLKPLAIAIYPMYRGLARLVGMEVVEAGTTLEDEFTILKKNYADYDFFFIHVKWTDSAGEDGDFNRKVKVLEQVDAALPDLLSLKPDVLVITGDHSTPAVLAGHSWHPVPVLIASKYCRTDGVSQFSEPAFIAGGLGRLQASQIMPLAMANALKLTKFGA